MKKDILGGTAAFQMTSDQVFGISLILIRFQQDIRENLPDESALSSLLDKQICDSAIESRTA